MIPQKKAWNVPGIFAPVGGPGPEKDGTMMENRVERSDARAPSWLVENASVFCRDLGAMKQICKMLGIEKAGTIQVS